jgi:hypothetical protein
MSLALATAVGESMALAPYKLQQLNGFNLHGNNPEQNAEKVVSN